jgi:hypothetical protein
MLGVVALRRWFSGFNSDQRRTGFQVALATAAVMGLISPAPLWEALTIGSSIAPTLAVVVIVLLAPFSVGLATWDSFSVSTMENQPLMCCFVFVSKKQIPDLEHA